MNAIIRIRISKPRLADIKLIVDLAERNWSDAVAHSGFEEISEAASMFSLVCALCSVGQKRKGKVGCDLFALNMTTFKWDNRLGGNFSPILGQLAESAFLFVHFKLSIKPNIIPNIISNKGIRNY